MADPDGQERTAVLLIAHGSRHAPANDDLHQLAARFAGRGDYPIVEAVLPRTGRARHRRRAATVAWRGARAGS